MRVLAHTHARLCAAVCAAASIECREACGNPLIWKWGPTDCYAYSGEGDAAMPNEVFGTYVGTVRVAWALGLALQADSTLTIHTQRNSVLSHMAVIAQ